MIRNDLPELFDVFDFADPHATTGLRPKTMVATQGLYFLNDESVMKVAEAIARRLSVLGSLEDRERVSILFQLVLGEAATDQEQSEMLSFIAAVEKELAGKNADDATLGAWKMACHALLASSRFHVLQ